MREHIHHVKRLRAVMHFPPIDCLPRWEWAMWWDATIARWHKEGLSNEVAFSNVFGISKYASVWTPSLQFCSAPPGRSLLKSRALIRCIPSAGGLSMSQSQ